MRTLAKVIASCALAGALFGLTGCGYDHNAAIPRPTSTPKSSPWYDGSGPTPPSTEKIKQALMRVNACKALTKNDVQLAFSGKFEQEKGPAIKEGVLDAECTYINLTSSGAVQLRIRYDPHGEAYKAAEKLADTTGHEPSESLGDHDDAKALYNSDGDEVVVLYKKYYVSLVVTTDHEPRDQLVALAQLVLLNLDDQLED